MKKYTFLLLCCAYLFDVGCGDDCSNCPKDTSIPDDLEDNIPYKKDDVVRFTNFMGDTVVFTCLDRKYSQEELRATERPQSDCCPSYYVENITCDFQAVDSNFLKISTTHVTGAYNIIFRVQIDGEHVYGETFFYDNNANLDSVKISNKTYYNVLSTTFLNPNKPLIAYLSLEGKGVIGFDVEGILWGMLE